MSAPELALVSASDPSDTSESKVLSSEIFLLAVSAAIMPMYLSMFRYDVGGAYFRLADVALILLLVGSLLAYPRAYEKLLDIRFGLLVLFCSYMLLQGLLIDNLEASLKEAGQVMIAGVWFSISSFYIDRNPDRYLKWLIGFMLISATYTMLYHFSIGHYTNYKLANNGRYAFGFLALLLLLANMKFQWRYPYPLLALISLVMLYFSMERKGILAIFVVLTIYLVSRPLGEGRFRIILGATLVSFVAVLFLFADDILASYQAQVFMDNFIDEEIAIYTSNVHRSSLLINGLQLFLSNPVFGLGADNVRYYMYDFYVDPELANSTHNFFLDSLLKFGAFGTSIMLALSISAIVKYKYQHVHGLLYGLLWTYCLLVVTFMVDGQSSLISFLMPSFMGGLFYANQERPQ